MPLRLNATFQGHINCSYLSLLYALMHRNSAEHILFMEICDYNDPAFLVRKNLYSFL